MKKLFTITLILLASIYSNAADPFIVAHRGASKDAPENTIAAFKLAWKQNADAIEGDFYLTKDKKIVCIHDGDTKRTAGAKLIVKESLFEDLRKLDVGAFKGENYTGQVIPTIAEVFKTIPKGKKIYIEVKDTERIVPYLLDEIKKSKLKTDQVVIISFKEKVIEQIKKLTPQYRAYWLSGFKKDKETGEVTPTLDTVLTTLKKINADGFSSAKDLIDQAFIDNVMQAGFEYHVWTVDDLQEALRFQKWGAMSITTNVPGYMKKNL